MAKLTGTLHGDAATALYDFYQEKALELEQAGQYFMATTALAFALETAILSYLLVEFGEENGGELEIPSSVNMGELIDAANEIDVLSAPINVPLLLNAEEQNVFPKHVSKDVVDKIRRFRNLIHPARALREAFDPSTFGADQYQEFREIYESVVHSLLYNL